MLKKILQNIHWQHNSLFYFYALEKGHKLAAEILNFTFFQKKGEKYEKKLNLRHCMKGSANCIEDLRCLTTSNKKVINWLLLCDHCKYIKISSCTEKKEFIIKFYDESELYARAVDCFTWWLSSMDWCFYLMSWGQISIFEFSLHYRSVMWNFDENMTRVCVCNIVEVITHNYNALHIDMLDSILKNSDIYKKNYWKSWPIFKAHIASVLSFADLFWTNSSDCNYYGNNWCR